MGKSGARLNVNERCFNNDSLYRITNYYVYIITTRSSIYIFGLQPNKVRCLNL